MFNAQKPDPSELPSTGKLLQSTGIAAVIASALLVLVVLPAEYGVDPTGAGSLLGLTEMGRIKVQLAAEAEADAAADASAVSGENGTPQGPSSAEQPLAVAPLSAEPQSQAAATPPVDQPSQAWSDTTMINLAPDDGYEVKLVMDKGATTRFEWFTNGPKVNYDTHGDGAGINYHGYGKGTNVDRQAGELTAAFTGSHGWFWRNRSGQPVTITVRTAGDYSEVKQYD